MRWDKLDARLAAALQEDPARPLAVFASLAAAPDEAGAELLHRLGVAEPPSGPGVVAVTARPADVAELSQRPWVHALTLARRFHLL